MCTGSGGPEGTCIPAASLFERLEQVGMPAMEGTSGPAASVRQHLIRLLNAHPGNSATAPELGLMDFNDATMGARDVCLQVREAIRRCIERYEPRIRHVEVRDLPQGSDPLQLRFQVIACFQGWPEAGQARFDLLLDGKGCWRVM